MELKPYSVRIACIVFSTVSIFSVSKSHISIAGVRIVDVTSPLLFKLGTQSCFPFHMEIPAPDPVNSRIDYKFQYKRREDAADHWGGDTLHYVRAGAG